MNTGYGLDLYQVCLPNCVLRECVPRIQVLELRFYPDSRLGLLDWQRFTAQTQPQYGHVAIHVHMSQTQPTYMTQLARACLCRSCVGGGAAPAPDWAPCPHEDAQFP